VRPPGKLPWGVPSDVELLTAWRAGDKPAGEALFDRHFAAVNRFFRNKAGDDLGDLVQRTFLTVLEARQDFRGEGSFRGYLLGIAYNVLRHHYRDRQVGRAIDVETVSLADVAARPSEVLAARREHRRLLEALRRVPLEHQSLLELYYWESMSASEIGEVLGVPEGTVRTRLRRAKQLLEERLTQLIEDRTVLETTLACLDDWAREIRAALD